MTAAAPVRRPDGLDVRTSWPALLVVVASCAVALVQSLREDPAAAVAAVLSLCGGALLGRGLRLELLFRPGVQDDVRREAVRALAKIDDKIEPRVLIDALAAGGDEAKRAFDAMMGMKKIDIAAIKAARRG